MTRRRIPFAVALLCATSLATRAAIAQEAEDCEPLDASSLEAVIERLSLDAEQAGWLRARWREGALDDPGDLGGLPGMSPELREELEGAWCWEPAVAARALLGLRLRDGGAREEAALQVTRGGLELRSRARLDAEAENSLRGAVRLARETWSVTAGFLRARAGLGLLLVTAGDEPRGDAPVEPAGGVWRPSLSFDERTAVGAAFARNGPKWLLDAALLRSRNSTAQSAAPQTWAVLRAGRRLRGGLWRTALLHGEGGWCGGLEAAGEAVAGSWATEWRWGGGGTAQGAFWKLQEGAWRVRAGLTRVGAGYAVAPMPLHREAQEEDGSRLRLEARWQGGPSRYVRAALEAGRERDPASPAWARETSTQLVELGERIVQGLKAGFLWRVRARRASGAEPAPSDAERLARAELSCEQDRWRFLLRLEERSSASGAARLTTLRAGRDGNLRWEARAGMAGVSKDGPDLWWYRRRAGGFTGWDRVPPGTWIGGWMGLPLRRWSLEISADTRDGGWEGAAAVRYRLEAPATLDPPMPGS